jgi:F0F1-type ATP synthase membrane subunit c/vacuolar-type H+-ATPase subunit K
LKVVTALSSWAAVIGTGLGLSVVGAGVGVGEGLDAVRGVRASRIADRPECTVGGLLVWGMVALPP